MKDQSKPSSQSGWTSSRGPTRKDPSIVLSLPFPPSLNHYYRHVGYRVLISRGGRDYRKAVALLIAKRYPCIWQNGSGVICEGRLSIWIGANVPDTRERDLDNMQKALLDALQHAGIYWRDSQIDDLRITRWRVIPPGRVTVEIKQWG
jgi:crossover junction endodeoxyribonuclease RusA